MIYLDMDGVIANWDKSAQKLLGKPVSQASRNQLWKRIDKEGFAFWADLEPYPWAQDFVQMLKRLDEVTILTSPSRDPRSASGKVRWLQKFFNDRNFRDYHITPHKHHLSKPGTVLIDDTEKKIDAFNGKTVKLDNPGVGILFPRDWNRNRGFSKDPVSYTVSQLKKIYPAQHFDVETDNDDYEDWLKEARRSFSKPRR